MIHKMFLSIVATGKKAVVTTCVVRRLIMAISLNTSGFEFCPITLTCRHHLYIESNLAVDSISIHYCINIHIVINVIHHRFNYIF